MTKDDFLDEVVEYYAETRHFTDEELEELWKIFQRYETHN